MAEAIDEHEQQKFFQDTYRSTTWQLLGGTQPPDNVDATELISRWSGPPANLKAASAVIFRYRLLDVLANVAGLPPNPHLPSVEGVANSKMSARLQAVSSSLISQRTDAYIHQQIRKPLANWTQPIVSFEQLLQVATHDSQHQAVLPVPLSPIPAHQHFLQQSISTLLSARQRISTSKYNKALCNLELVCFALSWYAMVGTVSLTPLTSLTACQGETDFPADTSTLLDTIIRYTLCN